MKISSNKEFGAGVEGISYNIEVGNDTAVVEVSRSVIARVLVAISPSKVEVDASKSVIEDALSSISDLFDAVEILKASVIPINVLVEVSRFVIAKVLVAMSPSSVEVDVSKSVIKSALACVEILNSANSACIAAVLITISSI